MKYLLFAFLICGLATNLSAGDITVLNPSFENQVFSLGTGSGPWPVGPITDWTEIQTDGTAYSVYHPGPGSYPGGAPDGANVAQVLEYGATASISQILGATLQANDTYTMSFYVGLRSDTSTYAPGLGCYGFDATLEAGGNVLNSLRAANGNQSCGLVTTGAFTLLSFTYSSGASPAGLGDPLEIVLTTNGSGSAYEPAEADFDRVALSDTLGSGSPPSAPEPATFGTLAGALAICVLRFRRRTAA